MGEMEPRDESSRLWELLPEIKDVFENTGYGSLAVESSIGIVNLCHASDGDIVGFANKPVISRWELINMPLARILVSISGQMSRVRASFFLHCIIADVEFRLLEYNCHRGQDHHITPN
jgi:hypothetical protein